MNKIRLQITASKKAGNFLKKESKERTIRISELEDSILCRIINAQLLAYEEGYKCGYEDCRKEITEENK